MTDRLNRNEKACIFIFSLYKDRFCLHQTLVEMESESAMCKPSTTVEVIAWSLGQWVKTVCLLFNNLHVRATGGGQATHSRCGKRCYTNSSSFICPVLWFMYVFIERGELNL